MLTPALNVTYVHNTQTLEALGDYFARCGGITGWDIETTPVRDYYHRKCRTVQFGNQTEQYVIDLLAFTEHSLCKELDEHLPYCTDEVSLYDCQGGYGKHLYKAPGLKPVFDLIGPVLCNRDILKVGVSLSFEYLTLYWNFGLRTQRFFDCGLVEKVIVAGYHTLKDYGYFSMEELMHRYFSVQIDKTLQESFTIDQTLSQAQIEYAALDTRLPISIKKWQDLILKGHTAVSVPYLTRFSPRILGDDLVRVAEIENDAIGAFQDMTLHGERIDKEKWLARVNLKKIALNSLILDQLDPIFIPLVGSKLEQTTQEEVDTAHSAWKAYTIVPPAELSLACDLRMAKKRERQAVAYDRKHPGQFVLYESDEVPLGKSQDIQLELDWTEAIRLCEKDRLKSIHNEMSKLNTKIKDLKPECDGIALINYNSDTQLLRCINANFPDIRKACGKVMVVTLTEDGKERKHWEGEYKLLENLDDDTFDEFSQFPVIKLIEQYHNLTKVIGTYGDAWAMEWVTHPCKEEGWLHSGDGRLHSTFNQLEAETGRTASEKPNGQNIEHDPEVRSCFIADPPDEDEPEGYVLITCDMAGAELRILADLANDPIWLDAFNRDQDVHSICVDLLDHELWVSSEQPGCIYFLNDAHLKCKCKPHLIVRDGYKKTNFGLPYGIGPRGLSKQIGKSVDETEQLMDRHRETFPRIWKYLDYSGAMTRSQMKSFDMFGRRRLFPEPTRELANKRAQIYREEELRRPEAEVAVLLAEYIATYDKKPIGPEKWPIYHREPGEKDIDNAERAMYNAIERQGKNHRIQGTNASIAKVCLAELWRLLPQYKGRLIKFVHDEIVVSAPKRIGQVVADLIRDSIRRAGAEVLTRVVMESESNIGAVWSKG